MLYPWQITEISCHSFHLVQCTDISYIADIKETRIINSSYNVCLPPTHFQSKKSVGERRISNNKTACLDLLGPTQTGVHYFETSPFCRKKKDIFFFLQGPRPIEILFHWKGSILPVQNISMNLPEAFLVEQATRKPTMLGGSSQDL